MFKEFYRNPKTGTHWRIYNHKTYWKYREDDFEYVEFYPFPTLKFRYNGDVLDEKRL